MKNKTILILNRVKLGMAILLLVADILAILACILRAYHAGTFLFLLLGGITFDYIRITWKETKSGLWFELENIET